jgi:subtilisin family serine protease
LDKLILAIIDSGVDKYIKINGVGIEHNENIDEYFVTNEVMDQNGHGTIVTNIIREIIDDENLYIVEEYSI